MGTAPTKHFLNAALARLPVIAGWRSIFPVSELNCIKFSNLKHDKIIYCELSIYFLCPRRPHFSHSVLFVNNTGRKSAVYGMVATRTASSHVRPPTATANF